jgi:hypothetical protein
MEDVDLGVALEEARETVLDEPSDPRVGAPGPDGREDMKGHRDIAQGGKPNEKESHA